MASCPVHGGTAHRAEVIRGSPAVAGAKLGRFPAVAGKSPRRRLAFYRHVLDRKSRLPAERAARPLLALVALAQRYALWVGAVVSNAELSAIARTLTGGHFPSCSLGSRSWVCLHGFDLARPPALVEERDERAVEAQEHEPCSSPPARSLSRRAGCPSPLSLTNKTVLIGTLSMSLTSARRPAVPTCRRRTAQWGYRGGTSGRSPCREPSRPSCSPGLTAL